MVEINQSISVQGISVIDEVNVAFMSANIPIDGKISINKQIQNKEAFEKSKDEVMKDFMAFDEYVYSLDLQEGFTEKNEG